MQPDPQQVQAAMEAMRAAAQVADRLDLGRLQFSLIADELGMTDLYQQVQERLGQLIRQGADTFEATAGALNTAAAGYDADERASVHRMKNIY